jgi:hypothetical protein
MNLLSDIITYIRRIIKSPSDSQITDNLLIDYINRFWIMDVDARIQLFDLKTKYQFQTTPGIDQYNMPLYDVQIEPGSQTIASFPVYQGFFAPARVNGINVPFYTKRSSFFDLWPNYVQNLVQAGTGDGTTGPYTLNLPFFPALPGHVDITGIIASVTPPPAALDDPIFGTNLNLLVPTTSVYSAVYFTATDSNGKNIVVADSGQFLSGNTNSQLYGLLMNPGNAPLGNTALANGGALATPYSTTQNTINYNTGVATNVYFPTSIPDGTPINAQCYFIQQGLPRAVLFYNNILTLRNPPDKQYLVELDAYLTPAAFLNTASAIPFGYMAEYIARGAARKILADTGDVEQFAFYEPLFKEQETLVWKRSQRQFTATRTETIYSNSGFQSNYNQSSLGT